jgi:hypothetical protein
MSSIFEKLNLKSQGRIVISNAPESFEPELATLQKVGLERDVKTAKNVGFVLAFVTTQREVDTLAKAIAKKAKGDAVVWFAYPKQSSKKYTSEINRDTGWQILGDAGFGAVRSVAIDEDWSAIRFRRVEFIKTMSRAKEGRLSKVGKARDI